MLREKEKLLFFTILSFFSKVLQSQLLVIDTCGKTVLTHIQMKVTFKTQFSFGEFLLSVFLLIASFYYIVVLD